MTGDPKDFPFPPGWGIAYPALPPAAVLAVADFADAAPEAGAWAWLYGRPGPRVDAALFARLAGKVTGRPMFCGRGRVGEILLAAASVDPPALGFALKAPGW